MKKNLLKLEFFELQLYFREVRPLQYFKHAQIIIYSSERVQTVLVAMMLLTWNPLLLTGLRHFSETLSRQISIYSHLQQSTVVDLNMKSQVVYSVLSITTGKTISTPNLTQQYLKIDWCLFCTYSIRKKIRDGHPEFVVTAESWPAFLYPHARGHNDGNVEHGLFRSAILLKVCNVYFGIQVGINNCILGLQIYFYVANICAGHWFREGCWRPSAPLEKTLKKTEGSHPGKYRKYSGLEICKPTNDCICRSTSKSNVM